MKLSISYKEIAENRIKSLQKIKRDSIKYLESLKEYLPLDHERIIETTEKIAGIDLSIAETKNDIKTKWL